MNRKWLPFWIVMALITIISAYSFIKRNASTSSSKLEPTSSSTSANSSHGTTTITQDEWKGVTCLDSTKKIHGKILTQNVWWLVRLDNDDNRIYKLYPSNWGQKNTLKVSDHNVQEWKLVPGQTVTQGKIAWEIVDQ